MIFVWRLNHEKQCACCNHSLHKIGEDRSEKFVPLYAALKEHLLQQVVVQADETPLNVLKEEKKCYMWLYCSGAESPEAALPNMKNIALYDYQNSRARACPIAFLGDYSCYLQTDGYAAYDGLHQVTNVGGLAHHVASSWTRRSFKIKVSRVRPIRRWLKSQNSTE